MRIKIIGVIPVRLESTRFPEKALALVGGVPLIERVYKAALSIPLFDEIVIATDSSKIADCASGFDGKVVMTSTQHRSGTERMSELLELFHDFDIFVNIQADQAFLNSSMVDALLKPYMHGEILDMTTIACPFSDEENSKNPNNVKVLLDQNNDAIYFSRSDIPFLRNAIPDIPVYHHLGLYAYSRSFLRKYITLDQTPLEVCESLEQLRVIEHGYKIRVNLIDSHVPEINTIDDIELSRKLNLL